MFRVDLPCVDQADWKASSHIFPVLISRFDEWSAGELLFKIVVQRHELSASRLDLLAAAIDSSLTIRVLIH